MVAKYVTELSVQSTKLTQVLRAPFTLRTDPLEGSAEKSLLPGLTAPSDWRHSHPTIARSFICTIKRSSPVRSMQ
jgi:hypothetical protein